MGTRRKCADTKHGKRGSFAELAMLNDDGTLLKILEIPTNSAPASMFGTLDRSGRGPAIFAKPVPLVPYCDSIIVVLNKSKFPLLSSFP